MEIEYNIKYLAKWETDNTPPILTEFHIITYPKTIKEMKGAAVDHARRYFTEKYNSRGRITVYFI